MQTPGPIEHNELFDLAFRFVSETNENIFLTGKAGTGKTTFLKYLIQHCAKNIVVAAPTGVAAINAGGVTLHSLFQLPLHPFLPGVANKKELLSRIKFNKHRQQLLRKMELLVIDVMAGKIYTNLRTSDHRPYWHPDPVCSTPKHCIGGCGSAPW